MDLDKIQINFQSNIVSQIVTNWKSPVYNGQYYIRV